MEKISVLLMLVISSTLCGLLLYRLARHGRNLQKFKERQLLRQDLHRFTVAILVAFAWYLVGIDLTVWRMLPLPDTVVLLLVTAVPTFLLCALYGRWYLGYGTALITQAFILWHHGSGGDTFQGSTSVLWGWQALLDLVGVVLWLVVFRFYRLRQQSEMFQRYLFRSRGIKMEKAGHGE